MAKQEPTVLVIPDANVKMESKQFAVAGNVIKIVNKLTQAASVLLWWSQKTWVRVCSYLVAETVAME